MSSGFPSYHQVKREVTNLFLDNLGNGGIPAVNKLVVDLAIEATAASAFAGIAFDVHLEAFKAQGHHRTIEEASAMLLGLNRDDFTASRRHTVAESLLETFRSQHPTFPESP